MNKIEFVKEKIPFTQVANEVLQDPNLSSGAKGLYAYLYSKPEGWDFNYVRISEEFKDSRKVILKYIHELEENGLLIRERLATGRVTYHILFPPKKPLPQNGTVAQKPLPQNSTEPKQHRAKMGHISNKDSLIIKNTNNKDSNSEFSSQINLILESFSLNVNPACKKMYGNKTQRAACLELIETYGYDEVINCVQNVLIITNRQPYFPIITTPIQLRDKWMSLKSAVSKKKSNTIEIVS